MGIDPWSSNPRRRWPRAVCTLAAPWGVVPFRERSAGYPWPTAGFPCTRKAANGADSSGPGVLGRLNAHDWAASGHLQCAATGRRPRGARGLRRRTARRRAPASTVGLQPQVHEDPLDQQRIQVGRDDLELAVAVRAGGAEAEDPLARRDCAPGDVAAGVHAAAGRADAATAAATTPANGCFTGLNLCGRVPELSR